MQDDTHPAGRDGRQPGRHLRAPGRTSLSCAAVADLLPALAVGEIAAGRRVRNHVVGCLRCQAEMARYRRVARQLRSLRDEPVRPLPTLAAQVVAGIDATWIPGSSRGSRVVRNVACVGGLSVATVAGAGVLMWMGRRRLVAAG